MSFDIAALSRAVQDHGRVARIVIASVSGSAPRNAGTSMLVWQDGQNGTIGGGTLEFEAATQARDSLNGQDWVRNVPLGPALGQCCGGAVTLICEVYDKNRLANLGPDLIVRRAQGHAEMPLPIHRAVQMFRNSGHVPSPIWLDGWMLEPVREPLRKLWVYGAGHVGRALIDVLAPLPEFDITWVDTGDDRFPNRIPETVTKLVAKNPADVVQYAPADAEHLILTYSHALDLDLCHRVLQHGFKSAGLIGSKTKWARFQKRLATLGHSNAQISGICCPIGQPKLGKHPQAIAVGVAAGLLSDAGMIKKFENKVG